ncbi:MAG: hypothetical protein ABJG86_18610 [Nitratireductor sp.]|uniref:hypothetical protein n=2 Tax=Pseudomonadota TaxID=1224 RepID=UPI00328545E5
MVRLKVLAMAAASGRVAYVFFREGQLVHWGLSVEASRSPEMASLQAEKWVSFFEPDVVVTEDIRHRSRKGDNTVDLIEALTGAAREAPVNDVTVLRVQRHANKYEEAEALAAHFPDILPWKPLRPRIWESEPRNMIYFEALALAVEVFGGDADPS